MIRIVFLCVLMVACYNLAAQDDTLEQRKMMNPVIQNLSLKHNSIYYKQTRMAKEDLLMLIHRSSMDSATKAMTINDFSKFYKYKSRKSGFPIVASFTLLTGLLFTAAAIVQDSDRRGGKIATAAVFGGAGIGFTTASIINAVKFKHIKRKLSKNYVQ